MRDILFRVWNKESKDMSEPFSFGDIESDSGYGDIYNPKIEQKNMTIDIVFVDDTDESYNHYELMQFTGLLDNNKTKIFEGDIVTYNGFGVMGIVHYGKYKRQQFMNGDSPHENLGFYIEGIPSYSRVGASNTHVYSLVQYNGVIIKGNIFENPELLEKASRRL